MFDVISNYPTIVYDSLTQLARIDGFWTIWESAFGDNYNWSLSETMRHQWAEGDFSQLPPLVVLDQGMGNILGAYGSSTNTIYLNQTFIDTASTAEIAAVILEEIGHSIDRAINVNDSPGDEGKIFSALVRGINLSEQELQVLHSQNDHATLLVAGQSLEVETATPRVTLTRSASVSEDDPENIVYTFTRDNVTNSLTVNFTVAGTATFNTDYTQSGATTFSATSGSITFAAGVNTATLTINPIADNLIEGDETVQLLLSASPTGQYIVGTTSSQQVIIFNDDPSVTLSLSTPSVTEDGTNNLVYTFTRNNTLNPLTVNFTVGGTASTNDYTVIGATSFSTTTKTGTVTFAAGTNTATLTIDPTADGNIESSETVDLFLSSSQTGDYYVGTVEAVRGTITNDDPTVSLSVVQGAVAEDGTQNILYEFTRNNTTNSLTVNFTVGGTAIYNNDYTATSGGFGTVTSFSGTTGSIRFNAGESTAILAIDPRTDSQLEADETVDITLAPNSNYFIGTPTTAQGKILNDEASISLSVSPLTVGEDGTNNLIYTFTRNNNLGSLTVNFSLGGTATLNTDYTVSGGVMNANSNTGRITFLIGASTVNLIIDPKADNVFEDHETVDVTISSGTDSSYIIGTPSTAQGKILDDDTEVSVQVSSGAVTEDGTENLIYTFYRTNTINPLTVNFLVGGTATLNTDYTQSGAASFSATTGSINFAAGANTAAITIDPKIDLGIESNETVTITLLNGTDYKLSVVNTAIGTIANDDLAGLKIVQTGGNSTQTTPLFRDNFTATGNPNTSDFNYSLAARQAGSLLGTTNWVRGGTGTTQVGQSTPNIDAGNYLLISNLGSVTGSFSGTAALDRNFNGVNAQGGLRISFDLAPNITGDSNQAVWGSFSLGLSSANKNTFVSANVPHFGILFRGNGAIRAFDGGADITGAYSNWGDTSNNATTRPFTVVLTDPTDDNPFDGVGQTNIDVYTGNTLIYSYVKGNGGYSDNYINFGAFASAGIDNLVIEKASGTTVTEGGATDTYTVVLNRPPTANVVMTFNPDNQLNTNVSSLTFTPSNWNVAQTVTVSAINDAISEGLEQRSLMATLTSSDPNYNNITLPIVAVTIVDNDLPSAGIRTYALQPSAFSKPLIDVVELVGFGEPIKPTIKPTLVDLDGDRDLDLVVINLGTLAYYENTGSLTNPIYTQKNVANYGLPSISPFNSSVLVNSSAFADLDGDRDLDLLMGFRDGTLKYYKNTGTVTNPNYVAQTGNNNPFNTIYIGAFSPTFADIDGDGDQDLIIGEKSGQITYYKNQGTFTNPVYVLQSGTLNPFATVGEVGTFATPHLTDEDGDGDYDLIVGLADGTIKYYKNQGTASNPNYVAQFLNPFAEVSVNGYASPILGDIDGDGDRDLIVGTGDGSLKYFVNVPVTPQSDLKITRNPSGLNIVPSIPTLPTTGIPVAYPFEVQGAYNTVLPINIDPQIFNTPTNLELEREDLAYAEPSWYVDAATIYSGDDSNWATLSDLAAQVNFLVPSSDRVTYRGTLLSYILIAAQKPVEDLTSAERKALDWVNIRIQQKRILEAKTALDYYDNWQLNPYSYRTPSGFGFDAYPYTRLSPGLGSIFLPPAPDVRRDAKAEIHRKLITTFEGQLAAASLTKGVQRYRKEFVDIVSLIETLQGEGLSQDQIYNTVLGISLGTGFAAAAVTTAAITISVAYIASAGLTAAVAAGATVTSSAALLGSTLSTIAASYASAIVGSSTLAGTTFGGTVAPTFGAVLGSSTAGTIAAVAVPVTVALTAVATAAGYGIYLFGSKELGIEGQENIRNNLVNELAAAYAPVDVGALSNNSDGISEIANVVAEAFLGGVSEQPLTDDSDLYQGTSGDDQVNARLGDDTLYGNDGNDYLDAGAGNNRVYGGNGNDILDAGDEDDFLDGGNGNDLLYGWQGNDSLYGGEGNDNLLGEDGNDFLDGGEGNDVLIGAEGDDTLQGGGGDDFLKGGVGEDTAVFTANYDQVSLTRLSSNAVRVADFFSGNNRIGKDIVFDVEKLTFNNGTYEVDSLAFPTFALFSDNFTATGNPTITNINYNQTTRQGGSLGLTNWVASGTNAAAVGDLVFSGSSSIQTIELNLTNRLVVLDGGTAALDRNFNGVNAQGGLIINFDLAPNFYGFIADQSNWGSFSLGLSSANKNAAVNANVPHFGILFRGNGGIQAFDGSTDVTGDYSSWGGTGNDTTLHAFSVLLTDPTDNNPLNGVGQTNIDVYAESKLIYSYIKTNGGYSDNYLNFGSQLRSAVDNVEIQRIDGTTIFAENKTGTIYTIPQANIIGNETIIYYLSGPDGNLFTLGGTNGQEISLKNGTFNYESPLDSNKDNIYQVNLVAQSGNRLTEKPLFIIVTDVNDAPVDISFSKAGISETTPANTEVGSLITIDPDVNDKIFTYSLVSGAGSTDNASFTLVGDKLTINRTSDFETKPTYNIRVKTTDQGGLSVEKAVTINVLDENDAPTNIVLSASRINENIPSGSVVSVLTTVDPDPNNIFTYSLVGNKTDNAFFTINGDQLIINQSPDFEAKNSYNIRVKATDQGGLSFEKDLAIGVENRNEAPTYTLLSDNFTVRQNPNTSDINYNLGERRGGSLGSNVQWTRLGNAQVGNQTAGIDGGNYLLTAFGSTAALDYNFNGAASVGGLKISFDLAPNSTNRPSQDIWGAINLGFSGIFKNSSFNADVSHFGIAFRGDGTIQAFDGFYDITGSYRNWGGTSNDGRLHSFTLIAIDPTDGNPFDGVGQTNISVYAGNNLIYNYVNGTGGYRDNYINFTSNGISGFDNIKIEKLGVVGFLEQSTATVYNAAAFDPDPNTTLTYSLSGEDAALFNVSSAGLVTFKTPPSYNTPVDQGADNIYNLTVTANDGSLTASKSLSVIVQRANLSPTNITLSNLSVDETVAPGKILGTFTTIDPNLDDSFRYRLLVSGSGSADYNYFTINDNRLILKNTPKLDGKTSYQIRVRTSDQGDIWFEKAFNIIVNEVNEAPTDIILNTSVINQNLPFNGVAGLFSSSDPDNNNTFTYKLIDGLGSEDNPFFNMNGNQLVLKKGLTGIYSQPNYSIRVLTTDQGGLSFEKILGLRLNQAPTDLSFGVNKIREEVAANTALGTFTTTDPNPGDFFTYSLVAGAGANDNSAFTINNDQLIINNQPNFATKPSYSLRVRTTDQNGLFVDKVFTIDVDNSNRTPTITSLGNANFTENGTGVVYSILASDPDANTTLTYSLTGTDANLFNVDSSGIVTFKNAPNFENPLDGNRDNIYAINVVASDGILSDSKAVQITVTNVREPALITSPASVTVTENSAGVVYTITAIDPEGNAPITYNLTGEDANLFTINNNTGVVSFKVAPNFENPLDSDGNNIYKIIAIASKGDLTNSKAIEIAVNNVNESPNFSLLSDNFIAPNNPNIFNLNYNLAGRQNGILGNIQWIGSGNTQIGNPNAGIDSGNYLLTALGATAALDYNFNGINSQGGLKISFDLAPNATGDSDQSVWTGISLGLSNTDKNAFINLNVPHFGILFRGNGQIQAFDGGNDVTGTYTSWGATGNNNTLYPFRIELSDPTDGNPFNGVGQTDIKVYRNNTLIYNYVKGNGGYSDNFINFGSFGIGGTDNLKIEKLGSVTFTENGTGVVYTATAIDPDGGSTLTYSLSGVDSNLFNISNTGAVTFKNAPVYASPLDNGANNIYDLIVTATDGNLSATQNLAIAVKPVTLNSTSSGTAVDGFIVGGTIFLDANFNGIREEEEPFTITNSNGQFTLGIPELLFVQFDSNGNGIIDLSEGRLAMLGGTDSASGLPFEGILTAPIGSEFVTPFTSILERIIRYSPTDLTLAEATNLVNQKLSFSSFGYSKPDLKVIASWIVENEFGGVFGVVDQDVSSEVLISDDLQAIAAERNWFDYRVEISFSAISNAPYRDINPETGVYERVVYEPAIDAASSQYLAGAQIQLISEKLAALTGKKINEILDQLADLINSNNGFSVTEGSYQGLLPGDFTDIQKIAAEIALRNAAVALTKEAYNQIDYDGDGIGDQGYGFASKTYNIYDKIFRINSRMQVIGENLEELLGQISRNELDISYSQFNQDFSTLNLVSQLDELSNIGVNVFPPQTADFARTILEDTSYTFTVADFPFIPGDPDDSFTSVIIENTVTQGTLKLGEQLVTDGLEISVSDIASGLLTFTPNANEFNANYAHFNFQVSDGKFVTDEIHTMTFNVTDVNDRPVANNDTYTVDEDNPLSVNLANGVLRNDSDIDGGILSVTVQTNVKNGQLTLNANGSLEYTPNTNFSGSDSFVYTVSDGRGGIDTGSVIIKINPLNDAPTNITLSNTKISENAVNNTLVGQLTVIDPDLADNHTYSLLNDAGGRFKLLGKQILVNGDNKLDYETNTSHQIQVRATDQDSLFVDKTFTIGIQDDRDFNISGTSNDDIINSGLGGDIIRGNGGKDIFRYTDYKQGGDTIIDFNPINNDRFDLSALYPTNRYNLGSNPFANYIRVSQVGTSTKINFAPFANLAPNYFLPLATLENVAASQIDASDVNFW